MSRTRKNPYSKSKAWDKTCRNHGACSYCERNRTFFDKKRRLITKDEFFIEEEKQEKITNNINI